MTHTNRIYFDYAAATPVLPEIWDVFENATKTLWANPNGIHLEAQKAKAALENARISISKILHCSPKELVFTGSATESNNLAIQGVISTILGLGGKNTTKPHILISQIEHPSVSNTIELLEKQNKITSNFIKISASGLIDLEDFQAQILPETRLVSIIWVSNEIGTIQDIAKISELLNTINLKRFTQNLPKILLHVDASQAFLFQKVDLNALNIDLLTLSGHKIYAPRGTALLYIKTGTKIHSITSGGDQENGLRSATQNTAGILAFAKAMELADQNRTDFKNQISKLQEYTFQKLIELNKTSESPLYNLILINGICGIQRVENNINFSLKNIDHQTLHTAIDLAGFAISGGSSCSSGSLEISPVIRALRSAANSPIPETEATLRLSLGKYNTLDELDLFFKTLERIVSKMI